MVTCGLCTWMLLRSGALRGSIGLSVAALIAQFHELLIYVTASLASM